MLTAQARDLLGQAKAAVERGARVEARALLAKAASTETGPGRNRIELAGLELAAAVDGDAAVLDGLQALAERAREQGDDEAYALAILERAEHLRAVGRLGDAAHHAELMASWGERAHRPRLVAAAALSLGLTLRRAGRIEQADGVYNHGLWVLSEAIAAASASADGDASAASADDEPLLPSLPAFLESFAGLIVQHARTSLELGHVARARECLDKVRDLPPAAVGGVGRALAALTAVEIAEASGRQPPREAAREAAASLGEEDPSQAIVELLIRLAEHEPDDHAADALFEKAASVARRVGTPAAIARAALGRTAGLLRSGRVLEAREALPAEAAPFAADRSLLAGMIALALGDAPEAVEPLLEAATQAEIADDAVTAARAWHLAASLYRRAGLVDQATRCRERAAERYSATGLRAPLVALEVERAWAALVRGEDAEAEAILAPLGNLDDLEVSAQVAICRAALARRMGRPEMATSALVRAHDRMLAVGARGASLALAMALSKLGGAIPGSVEETLAWASSRGLQVADPTVVPPLFKNFSEH